jgi:hypothetical protein
MTRGRTMYMLDSKPDQPAETNQAWEDAHTAATRCPRCNRWRADVVFASIGMLAGCVVSRREQA